MESENGGSVALEVLLKIAGVDPEEGGVEGWEDIGELAERAWREHCSNLAQLEGARRGLDACSRELRSRDEELARIQEDLDRMSGNGPEESDDAVRALEEQLEEARRELSWEKGAHAACMSQLEYLAAKSASPGGAASANYPGLEGIEDRELEVSNRLVEDLERENERMGEELIESLSARKVLAGRLESADRRLEELMGEVSRKEESAMLLREEMREVEAALKEEVDARDCRIRQLERMLADRDAQVESLAQQRDASLSAEAARRAKLELLDTENAALRRDADVVEQALSSIRNGSRDLAMRLELASTPSRPLPSPPASSPPPASWAQPQDGEGHITYGPGSPPPVDLQLPNPFEGQQRQQHQHQQGQQQHMQMKHQRQRTIVDSPTASARAPDHFPSDRNRFVARAGDGNQTPTEMSLSGTPRNSSSPRFVVSGAGTPTRPGPSGSESRRVSSTLQSLSAPIFFISSGGGASGHEGSTPPSTPSRGTRKSSPHASSPTAVRVC